MYHHHGLWREPVIPTVPLPIRGRFPQVRPVFHGGGTRRRRRSGGTCCSGCARRGDGESNKPSAVHTRVHPQGEHVGLTPVRATTYRWQVCPVRPVSTRARAALDDRCARWRQRTTQTQPPQIRAGETYGEPREQAHLPAEQPPPAQDARLPPADAYARRSVDPVRASPQGSQELGRLSQVPCCPSPIDSATQSRSVPPYDTVGVPAAGQSCCTFMSPPR